MPDDGSQLGIGSPLFVQFCNELDALSPEGDARCLFDGMSGGFKFSDEFPRQVKSIEDYPMLALVSLLRCLWAYRTSVVRTRPRVDLLPWWEATKKLAPNWPGFLQQRCSAAMLSTAEECAEKGQMLSNDLVRLNKHIEEANDAFENGRD